MAVTHQAIYVQAVLSKAKAVLPADSTNLVTVYTATGDGCRIDNIIIQSTDTSAKDMALYLNIGGTDYQIGMLSVLANSGNTNAIPSMALMSHSQFPIFTQDSNLNRFILMASGDILKVKMGSAITAAKQINVIIQGGTY